MVAAAALHKSTNAAIVSAFEDAEAKVQALVAASGGTDQTAAKQGILDGVVADTTAAEGAVATQRARIEALIEAKRTQDQEEALWGERVTTANNAVLAATTAKSDADTALTEAQEQVTTRSWLFETLGAIDATSYAAACNTGSNAKCAY